MNSYFRHIFTPKVNVHRNDNLILPTNQAMGCLAGLNRVYLTKVSKENKLTEKIIAKALNNPFLSTLVMDETRYVILRSAQASFYLNVTAGEFVQILRNERKPPASWKVGDIKKSELPTRVAKAMRKTAGEELIKISWGDDMSVINQVSVYFSLDEIFEGLKN